jgi:hypothetical protein
MRWKISPWFHSKFDPRFMSWSHDPRAIDLLAVLGLLVLVLGSGWYLSSSVATPPSNTDFIVPSQSVRW